MGAEGHRDRLKGSKVACGWQSLKGVDDHAYPPSGELFLSLSVSKSLSIIYAQLKAHTCHWRGKTGHTPKQCWELGDNAQSNILGPRPRLSGLSLSIWSPIDKRTVDALAGLRFLALVTCGIYHSPSPFLSFCI